MHYIISICNSNQILYYFHFLYIHTLTTIQLWKDDNDLTCYLAQEVQSK